ncbi:MAG: hypothetical protein F4160_05165 [Rhodospirillaceae bacterium]|nr:hypothetical protein [Rhodospirillaceae bacterium]
MDDDRPAVRFGFTLHRAHFLPELSDVRAHLSPALTKEQGGHPDQDDPEKMAETIRHDLADEEPRDCLFPTFHSDTMLGLSLPVNN